MEDAGECARSKTLKNAEGRLEKWRRKEEGEGDTDGRTVHLDKEAACARDVGVVLRDCCENVRSDIYIVRALTPAERRPCACAADRE